MNEFVHLVKLASFSASLLVLSSCGGGGGGGGGGGNTTTSGGTTTVIGTTGGSASLTDGSASIQIPAGALATSTSITIASSEDKAGQSGNLYQVTGTGGTDLTFQQPVTIKLKYDPATVPVGGSEAGLKIGLLGPFDSWEILTDSTVDTVNKVITATTTHFSEVGVLSASNVAGAAPKLNFPLQGRDPYTAVVNSVFDHSMIAAYCEDGKVQTYSGDIGQSTPTACMTFEKNIKACGNHKTAQVLCDFDTGGVPVTFKNGNANTTVISYDGHPGYDYRTTDQTSVDGVAGHVKVFAAAGGTAHVVANWKWGTVWIQHENGYSTHYLHLDSASVIEGQIVSQGEQIGVAGKTAPFTVGPHLHFEVKRDGIPIDPYAPNLWSAAPPSVNDTTPPSVPTSLAATALSSSQINLTWAASTDDVGVAGYKIYRGGNLVTSQTTLSFSDTGLSPSTQYCYAVSAFDSAGNVSVQSSQQCASTLALPNAPTGVSATVGNGQATISWNAVAGVAYNLYMASVSGVTKSNYSSLTDGTQHAGVTSPFIQTGLTNGTTYYFVVTAVDANGESSESAQVSVTPSPTLPPVISPGTPSVLASGSSNFWAIALDNNNVYWTDVQNHLILKVPKSGGATSTLATTQYTSLAISVFGNFVYWAEQDGNTGFGSIRMVGINGGTTTTIASNANWGLFNGIRGLVVDSSGVYWSVAGNNVGSDGMILKISGVPVDNPVLLSQSTPIVLASGLKNPMGMTFDGNNVYWIDSDCCGLGGAVKKIDKAGGMGVAIASGLGETTGIATDGVDVFFGIWNEFVHKVPVNGGPALSLGGYTSSQYLVVDSTSVYFTSLSGDSIGKMNKDGTGQTTLATGLVNPWGLAVDSTGLYWTECPTCSSPSVGAVKMLQSTAAP